MQVDVPINTIDELTQTIADDKKIGPETTPKKQLKETTEAELSELMRKLLEDKLYTRKRIDQLVEKALLLKSFIK